MHRILIFCLLPLVLVAAVVVGAETRSPVWQEPDPLAVQRHGPAWRYPQAGWVVLHLEGSPYDRGYQHGHLLAAEIVDYIKTLATGRSPKDPAAAWKDFRIFTQAFFLKRFAPEWLEEMKGIADGAAAAGAKFEGRRLDLIDIVAINADVEVSFLEEALKATPTGLDAIKYSAPQYSQPKVKHQARCSAFVATGPATRDGKIVAGHITMSDLPFVRHYNIWLDLKPAQGQRIVFQTFPGGIQSGLDYYLSDSGLIVSETTINQTHFNSEGETVASRIRRVVQYAKSIDEAVAILKQSNNGLYTNEWLFGDTKSNEIAMLELGTKHTRLWRSSKNEWPEGTIGFYWGCNSTKDRQVLTDTVADLRGKPANLVLHPERRDLAWLRLFNRRKGTLDEAFGFEAFSTPPLVGFPSCDAKFTTAALARDLKSWALLGPPLGRTWEPTAADREHNPTVKPMPSNDWTLLSIQPPAISNSSDKPVDLALFPDEEDELAVEFDQLHPFVWRGTLLPKTDADLWLAAAFAEYEKVVAFEQSLQTEAGDKPLETVAKDAIDLALFTHESAWFAAARRLGRNVSLADTQPGFARDEWYSLAVGQGVRLLAELRQQLGHKKFVALLDEFGSAHAGQEVGTAEFRQFIEQADIGTTKIFANWLDRPVSLEKIKGLAWSIYSFEEEPERTLIVYGTLGDVAAQREAAVLLERTIARRFNNFSTPIKSDQEVTDGELQSHHLLLVGRPATNRITEKLGTKLPVKFGRQSFTVRGETFAHAESAVIVAGDNPLTERYSIVVFAGLSASGTRHCVQTMSKDDVLTPQVIVLPAGRHQQAFRVR